MTSTGNKENMTTWNLALAQNMKELIFNASLPIILLVFCLIRVYKSNINKKIKYLFSFAVFLLSFFCFYFTPQVLGYFLLSVDDKKLEKYFDSNNSATFIQIPACVQNAKGIIVLGAGSSYMNTPSFYGITRIIGLIELLKTSSQSNLWQRNKTPLIFSGGFTTSYTNFSEAQILKNFSEKLESKILSKFNVLTENESKNTHENAFYVHKNFIEKNIILITNSFHMTRAKKTFEAQGFSVCPVSVASQNFTGSGLFTFDNANKTVTLLNEYFGIAGYFMKGWL